MCAVGTVDAADEEEGLDPAIALYRQRLLVWYAARGRAFPWREDRDPYRVLIAERMLHRTQARQVVPVYDAFLSRFPSPHALAAADPTAVSVLLAPLGLPWRFASFIPMAREIVARHGGLVPQTVSALRALPGVGMYTAEAVLCFAFDHPVAVVDTNTIRVTGRYLHAVSWIAEARRRVGVRADVARLLDPGCPADANYAALDLGALICVAGSPLCDHCPVAAGCAYHTRQGTDGAADRLQSTTNAKVHQSGQV